MATPKPTTRTRIKNTDAHYINAKEMHEEIVAYYATPVGSTPSNSLGEKLMKIASRLSYQGRFRGYSFREDMANLATRRMLDALLGRKYNVEKGTNPFAYFTRIAWNCFRASINEDNDYLRALTEYGNDAYHAQYDYGKGWENVRRRAEIHEDMDDD